MDFKRKGRAWVGSIYQKFEAVCQEVDNFVNQDTTKYAGNQAETVDGSMKKICSDVVEDSIPPLADSVTSDAQAVPLEDNDKIINNMSMMSIEEKPALDPLSSIDPIKDGEFKTSLAKDNYGVLIYENPDIVVEENAIKEESYFSNDLEIISPRNKESSETSFNHSTRHNYGNSIPVGVLPPTFDQTAELESTRKEGTSRGSFLDGAEYVSDVSSENNLSEMDLISSRDSSSAESQSLETPKIDDICRNSVDAIGCISDHSDALESLDSFQTHSCNNKAEDMGLAFSSSVMSFESNEIDVPGTDETISMVGSSGNGHEHWCGCPQIETSLSCLGFGETEDFTFDISDPSMETIELSDKVKLEHSSVFVDDKLLYAASFRARKHRSYKKLIQDVFASKKRLTKEYEHLGIWYGDIDIESTNNRTQQNISPFLTSTSSDSKKSSEDICGDLEWELL